MTITPYSDPKLHGTALIYHCMYIQCKITINGLSSSLSSIYFVDKYALKVIHFV